MKKTLMIVVGLALMFAPPASAGIINFDTVANATVINTLYSGVTFTTLFGGVHGGNDYARTSATTLSRQCCLDSLTPASPRSTTGLEKLHAAFDSAQTSVSNRTHFCSRVSKGSEVPAQAT